MMGLCIKLQLPFTCFWNVHPAQCLHELFVVYVVKGFSQSSKTHIVVVCVLSHYAAVARVFCVRLAWLACLVAVVRSSFAS